MTTNWKRTLLVGLSIGIGIYLLLAITTFNSPAEDELVCNEVHITIKQDVVKGFLTPTEVKRMLDENGINPRGKQLKDVNVRTIEEKLEQQELIDNAECYKAQNGAVHISINERVPVMRVMAGDGDDYYIDNDGNAMQNTGYTCNLMVATGSISRPYAKRVLAPLGKVVMNNDFWRNQIVQINVLPDSTVEMVPRVGEHIIYLGPPTGVTRKLERLRKFYQYGLGQAGWNKYSRISVEYSNQIVCKKNKNK
jgi:cell division protein FtsQ